MWQSLPDFGTLVLCAVLVTAGYAFGLAVLAHRGRPRLLGSARLAAYATAGLVALGVTLLAYGFITHDFRIRYVSHYSDRSMSTGYLIAALWGGQDGSLLWWSALLALYTTTCIAWMRGKYRELQPIVIATLMVIIGFFAVLMLFAANPFQTNLAGPPGEGEGLNPLLQNYWMIIHPPMLYAGFVGCSIPFAFAIAALVTGRLDNEWIVAVRKWMLFAWLGLSIGNALGMVWAYEELGWGGFWAWDPVENAAALPWFTATAYLHSTLVQERRGMFRIWNIGLVGLTFFLTIFGTFLTRSGLISSVHSFAQSGIGIYFVWFMALLVSAILGLLVWRLPRLRAPAELEALLSRETAFVANNWALLGVMTFVAGATVFPKLSEWLWHETITVGPPFFNRWVAPLGLLIFLLMGLAPLLGWRKTSSKSLLHALRWPVGGVVLAAVLHLALGKRLGMPAWVPTDAASSGVADRLLATFGSITPLITICLAALNVVVVVQEYALGLAARRRASRQRGEREPLLLALVRLVSKSRRRYGGYIVHLGITAMFLGFVGTQWAKVSEASLLPGESMQIGSYQASYRGVRMCPGNPGCTREEQSDTSKRRVIATVDLRHEGKALGRVEPAQFIYQRGSGMTTTEIGLMRGMRADIYVVVGSIQPTTKRAQLRVHVNPYVSFIWLGVLVLILGATLSLWPETSFGRLGAWSAVRFSLATATAVVLSLGLASSATTRGGPAKLKSVENRRYVEQPAPAGIVGLAWLAPAFGLTLSSLRRRGRGRGRA